MIVGLPCRTVVRVSAGRMVVTCEQHPEFRVPMRSGVETIAPDEIGRFHRENPDVVTPTGRKPRRQHATR